MLSIFLSLILVLAQAFLNAKPVYAQVVVASQSATASGSATTSAAIVPTPAATDETSDTPDDPAMTALRATYDTQLSDYRDAERQYQINIGQYTQLQTLDSLESAVQATHTAQVLRDQVLLTYLSMLNLRMNEATGIDLDQKTHSQSDLNNAITALRAHLVASNQASSRDDVNQVAATFTPLEAQVQTAAYEAQTLLAIGKLQTIYDKANALTDEIDTNLVEQNNDVKQPQRQRAIVEIRQTLAGAKSTIDDLIAHRVNGTDVTFSQGTYDNSLADLNQIYAQLSQTLSFLDELLRL